MAKKEEDWGKYKMKKGIGLGILYTEIMSIPMLVQVPIFLKQTASDSAELLVFFLSCTRYGASYLG
jgi:hypothetical protein